MQLVAVDVIDLSSGCQHSPLLAMTTERLRAQLLGTQFIAPKTTVIKSRPPPGAALLFVLLCVLLAPASTCQFSAARISAGMPRFFGHWLRMIAGSCGRAANDSNQTSSLCASDPDAHLRSDGRVSNSGNCRLVRRYFLYRPRGTLLVDQSATHGEVRAIKNPAISRSSGWVYSLGLRVPQRHHDQLGENLTNN